ncbi:MAG: methionine adenosyltransferase [Candidatus Woesearchaeota archaeon]
MITSESVSKGHPDKVCDIISDSILDEALKQDKESKVAIETWVKDNNVGLIGEITTTAKLNYEKIVRKTLKEIGYEKEEWGINPHTCKIYKFLGEQSPEIKKGVENEGAGDQGIMWGYATNETKEYLPLTQVLANKLLKKIELLKIENKFLRPDMKSQITIDKQKIKTIILAVQHDETITQKQLKEFLIENAVKPVCSKYLVEDTNIIINGTGSFIVGGPKGDAGLTGRKIIIDTYGGEGRHGGGAFSGKDPTKVDRSAAYMVRHIAKNLVANKFGSKAEVQLSYAIGKKDPQSIRVVLDGKQAPKKIENFVRSNFPLEPKKIIDYLGLQNPVGWSYKETATYSHFDDENYPWEKIKKLNRNL